MRAVTVLIAGVLLLAGCGNDSEPVAGSTTTAPTRPKLDGPYVGSWFAELGERRAARLGDPRLAGKFRLELRADGTYTSFQELDGESEGRYRTGSGDRLVFGKDAGCEAGGRGGTAVYGWSVRGGTLRLRVVESESGGCTGRTQSLTYPLWERR